jgi:hypothetical protein
MPRRTTDLEKRSPSPAYTRWDQRGDPVLLCYLKHIGGKSLCLSLQTADPEIAKRHMRLLVAWLLAEGRLSPDSGAAKAYPSKSSELSRVKKIRTEVRQLKLAPDPEYGSQALATAQRRGLPVGIIYCMTGRKPALSAGTYRTRRMRARKRGQQMPMGDTWEDRPQGGKYFFWNSKVLTARLQIDRRTWQWPLKVIDEQKAEALTGPVRAARQRLRRARVEERNCKLGTDEAVAAAVTVAGARAHLASAIITAGGPKELAEFVLKGPKRVVGMASPLPMATALNATKQAKIKQCVAWLADLISTNPDRPPVQLAELRKQAKSRFGIARRLFEEGNNSCIRQAQRMTKNFNWRKGGRPRG